MALRLVSQQVACPVMPQRWILSLQGRDGSMRRTVNPAQLLPVWCFRKSHRWYPCWWWQENRHLLPCTSGHEPPPNSQDSTPSSTIVQTHTNQCCGKLLPNHQFYVLSVLGIHEQYICLCVCVCVCVCVCLPYIRKRKVHRLKWVVCNPVNWQL